MTTDFSKRATPDAGPAPAPAHFPAQRAPLLKVRRTAETPLLINIAAPAAEITTGVAVIVPTRHERGNIEGLVERLEAAFPDGAAHVVFVDDSDDDTSNEIERVAHRSRSTVEVIHRRAGERDGGLGGAVLRGLHATPSRWVVVMDGDLQHPPEVAPELVAHGRALRRRRGRGQPARAGRDEGGLAGRTSGPGVEGIDPRQQGAVPATAGRCL